MNATFLNETTRYTYKISQAVDFAFLPWAEKAHLSMILGSACY